MRFHVDFDLGDEIRFWIVPDNPEAAARVYLFVDHTFRGLVASNDERPVLKEWGWHSTGQVAFRLQDSDIPGISGASFIEVYDVDTLVLIYRRTPLVEQAESKLFRYTTGLTPDTTIDRSVFDVFRLNYSHVETIPEETLQYVFDYHYSSSIYVSGRLQAKRIRRLLDKNSVKTTVVFDDPYRLLARQILWLRSAADLLEDDARRWRVARYESAIRCASALSLGDDKALKRQLGRLDDETFDLLSNPVVRQFGSDSEEGQLATEHYISAVDEVSRLTVVGHASYFPAYPPSLSALIGIDIGEITPPEPRSEEEDLALLLRQVPTAQTLIEYDLDLVDTVEQAIADQWSQTG